MLVQLQIESVLVQLKRYQMKFLKVKVTHSVEMNYLNMYTPQLVPNWLKHSVYAPQFVIPEFFKNY